MIGWIEQKSALCGLIRQNAEKCRIAIPPPKSSNRKLVDTPSYTPGEYTAMLADFGQRLESIVAYAERVGAIPVLVIPAANDAGIEPSRSFLPATTSRGEPRSICSRISCGSGDRRRQSGCSHESAIASSCVDSPASLKRTTAWPSCCAKGKREEAYGHYVAARDLDGFPMRCPSAFQQVYREVASRHDCILIDTQSYFHAIARDGVLDYELFQDAMHPSLRGLIASRKRSSRPSTRGMPFLGRKIHPLLSSIRQSASHTSDWDPRPGGCSACGERCSMG